MKAEKLVGGNVALMTLTKIPIIVRYSTWVEILSTMKYSSHMTAKRHLRQMNWKLMDFQFLVDLIMYI